MRATNPTISILTLDEITRPLLSELLLEECREWLTQLLWDYSESSEIIQQVANAGNLPGLIAVDGGGKPVGYCFWIQEGRRVLIGDLFVIDSARGQGIDFDLVESMLNEIGIHKIDRIESQNIGFGLDGIGRIYRKHGFVSYNRHFLIKRINNDSHTETASSQTRFVSGDRAFKLRQYHSNDFAAVCRLVYDSYIDQPDSVINSQYATYSGCKEFFGNLISNTGCGSFLRAQSLIAEIEEPKKIIGAIITTAISPGNAHLPQISVLPEFQRLGLGRRMIEVVFNRLREAGYRSGSLAVSADNKHAVKLYESCGFKPLMEFPVFVKTF
jgi:ribosomal protein S18 acetylase RimI-like enzyme